MKKKSQNMSGIFYFDPFQSDGSGHRSTKSIEQQLKQDIKPQKLYTLSVSLIFFKILCVTIEYGSPLIINELTQAYQQRGQVYPFNYNWIQNNLWGLYICLIVSTVLEYISNRFYAGLERKLMLLTNAYLSKLLFAKSLRLYDNLNKEKSITFQGMLKELRQIEGAIDSFYCLIRVFFELIVGGLFLQYQMSESSNTIFNSLKWGVLVSFLALGAATFAQIYSWRIQYFSDQRLKLTQDIISGIKNIKYLSWEHLFEQKLLQVRNEEFKGITGIQYVDAMINFFRRMTSVVLMFATFYSLQEIPTAQFYTILIFFDKFIQPLNTFPWCLGEFLGSLLSVIHIKNYLDQPECCVILFRYEKNIISKSNQPETYPDVGLIEYSNKTIAFPQVTHSPSLIEKSINFLTHKRNHQETNTSPFQLKIDFQIKQGTLNMIIGPVGSGKTALLDSLIGEMIGHKQTLKGSLAYVGQNPWIFSGTVRDNVLFGEAYEKTKFQKCLYSSDLVTDLNGFPEGDLKNVGFNGTNLSGGQKQRLAICRALYQDADIYLFDDILSSVDEHVADLIMHRTVTLYLKGKTILHVLNQSQYLQYADSIIIIENHQTSQHFRSSSRYKELVGMQSNSQQLNHEEELVQINQSDQKMTEVTHQKQEADIEAQNNIKDNYKYYIEILGLRTVTFFIFTSLLQQAFKGLFELWTHSYINSMIEKTQPFLILDDFQSTFILFFITLGSLTLLRGFAYSFATLHSAQSIFKKVTQNFLKIPTYMYDNNNTAYFIKRQFTDMEQIDDLPLNHFFSVGLDAVGLIAIISYQQIVVLPCNFSIIYQDSMVCILFLIKFNNYFRNLSQQQESLLIDKKGNNIQDLHSFIKEVQTGLKTFRASGKTQQFQQRFQDIQQFQYSQILLKDKLRNFGSIYNTLIQNGCFLALVYLQIFWSGVKNEFDTVNNSLALTYAFMLFGSHKMSSCVQSSQKIIQVSSSLQRLRQLSEAQIESQVSTLNNQQSQINDQFILFCDVWLNYSIAKKQQDKQLFALKGVSFVIEKGQKVAFCGRTGSGKSSIFNLLVKLYDKTKGDILLNNQSIEQCSPIYMRSQMSVIPQNGFLFSGSLLSNLNPKGDQDQKKIMKFLKDYKLLSDRLEIIINDGQISTFQIQSGGQNLSNGEKQIINFVQQVLELKEIVCIDEATSNMDQKTNDAVMNALFQIIGDRTLLLISHKLDNLQNFDKIIVMSEGRIVGQGTYDELNSTNKQFQELKSQLT